MEQSSGGSGALPLSHLEKEDEPFQTARQSLAYTLNIGGRSSYKLQACIFPIKMLQ